MPISTFRLAAICFLTSLAGCSGSEQQASISTITASAPATPAAQPRSDIPRVALIMKTLTNPFFIEMEQGARRAQQETGIDLTVKTATQETSIEQQIKIVEDATHSGVDAIVIAPGDSVRLVPALKQAQQQGITIVNIDNRLNAQAMATQQMQTVPFISIDNEAAAFASATALAKRLHAGAEVAIIEGIPSADNAEQRRRGAQRAFKQAGLKLVASQSAHWKIDEAYAKTQKILQQHPRVRGIFCANDMMAIGASKYLREQGRQDVQVAGFDAIADARQAVARGQMVATVDQRAAEQGYQGVMVALKAIRKQPVSDEIMIQPIILRTAESRE
ncbi:substrate-binding domain-containing protein [Crenobacter caeni]|uniref:Sugar ABC transporter substrate-binding protein n=1 Tax=Crenobacter caeni TaxID=2705474 RepID=A0A6B2KU57_9NEIS|nr:substrate-binding domain-containing protein [Crenobacter caeni]NDV13678.1 sugar ABC transporter substrate-binding protein [Crenobacter caeni]